MRFGIRLRFALWLIAALLPVSIAAAFVFGRMEAEISDRVGADLQGVRSLEASRIENALDAYLDNGRAVAGSEPLRLALEEQPTEGPAAGGASRSLQDLADALQREANATAAEVVALRIVGTDGATLGETIGFDWTPSDSGLVERTLTTGVAAIGNAFRDGDSEHRLGLVVPVIGSDKSTIGALMLENELGPIVELVDALEVFGATSEAHLVQLTASGDGEYITPLRFDEDAAFNKTMPGAAAAPISVAMTTLDGAVIRAKDYRGEDSILAIEAISHTGWALIVKIDEAEALAPVLDQVTRLRGVALLGVVGLLFGWAVFLDPIARRLRKMAAAAERVASGEYDSPLDDRSSDELGTVAMSIDRLATDLATDIAVRTDIESRLREQATRDATTGLFNRQYAAGHLRDLATLAFEDASAAPFSVLFIDLDNFKATNDSHGHAAGDAVLQGTGRRLASVVGSRGTVARWGGDEFVVVLPRALEDTAAEITKELQVALGAPIETELGVYPVRASIGHSTHQVGGTLEDLLHSADQAMFLDKKHRSGGRSISPESVRTVERALGTDGVEVWFQPLVSGSGSRVMLRGAEALVRLRDADGRIIEPRAFLRDIERSTIGRDLDRRVMRRALEQVAGWLSSGSVPSDFQLSVNCCEAMMSDVLTPSYMADLLDEFGLDPSTLMLEISERSAKVQPSVVHELDRLGIRIAVDDLGLSNSNIDRLLDEGASVAKIDRRWLQDDGVENDAVLRHLVSLCDSLGFEVIAEGIETTAQYTRMSELGVSTFQGYLFARPLSGVDFEGRFFADIEPQEKRPCHSV